MQKCIEELTNLINSMPDRNAHYYEKEDGKLVQKEAFADCDKIAVAVLPYIKKCEDAAVADFFMSMIESIDKEIAELNARVSVFDRDDYIEGKLEGLELAKSILRNNYLLSSDTLKAQAEEE